LAPLLLLTLTSRCNWLLPLGSAGPAEAGRADAAGLAEAGWADAAGRDAPPVRDCLPCTADADVGPGGDAAPDGPADLELEGAEVKDAVLPQVDLSLYCADIANWLLSSGGGNCYADCNDPNGPLRTVACDTKVGGCTCTIGGTGGPCPSGAQLKSCDQALLLGCCRD
jgi:hypothetical protein